MTCRRPTTRRRSTTSPWRTATAWRRRRRLSSSVAAVHRHDARAAEPQVVLERDLRALDLTLLGLATQVPHELGALREARGAERVALREQAARRVRHELA